MMLQIINYSKSYGNKKVIDKMNLEVQEGELYGFIGHNGAGKTTTIKSICGILDFEEGDILIDGISIKKQAMECKKKLAYVPDNPDLYDSLTGIKYLNFIADIYGVSKEDREKGIQDYATQFGLINNLGDSISSYSHGMKQKLALISALIHKPKLLILDEPFVGLDPKASFELKEIMRGMCDRGCAIFFSTHVLEVAQKLCDKVAIIKNGKIIVSGTIDSVIGNQSLEEVFLELEDHE